MNLCKNEVYCKFKVKINHRKKKLQILTASESILQAKLIIFKIIQT